MMAGARPSVLRGELINENHWGEPVYFKCSEGLVTVMAGAPSSVLRGYMPLPLPQTRWQMPTLHGIVVGSGAGSGLEHPNLGISKFPPPPTFCFNLLCLILY